METERSEGRARESRRSEGASGRRPAAAGQKGNDRLPFRSQSAHRSVEARQCGWSKGAQEGGCVREGSTERQPALVSEGTTQAGDVRSRWAWTEPSVWTDRMLEALENGVKGGRWYSLHDKAFSVRALEAAFAKVKANKGAPGVDNWTISRFETNLAREIPRLSKALLEGTYRPRA